MFAGAFYGIQVNKRVKYLKEIQLDVLKDMK